MAQWRQKSFCYKYSGFYKLRVRQTIVKRKYADEDEDRQWLFINWTQFRLLVPTTKKPIQTQ